MKVAVGLCSSSSNFKECVATKVASAGRSAPGLLAGLQECFMGLINSANSVSRWTGTLGEAIRAALPFKAFRVHL